LEHQHIQWCQMKGILNKYGRKLLNWFNLAQVKGQRGWTDLLKNW